MASAGTAAAASAQQQLPTETAAFRALQQLDPRQRHARLVSVHASAQASKPYRSDMDVVRSAHRFLWDPSKSKASERFDGQQWGAQEEDGPVLSWEQRLAKRYYAQLFREYALADMSRYREGAIGLRWRTERETFDGKGQFICGNKGCNVDEGLASFELNFAYVEHGEQKQALVKLRTCPRAHVS